MSTKTSCAHSYVKSVALEQEGMEPLQGRVTTTGGKIKSGAKLELRVE